MLPGCTFRKTCLALAVFHSIAAPANAVTITVTNPGDSLANDTECTLREALISANSDNNAHEDNCAAGGGPDTIEFNLPLPATITLTSDLPSIINNLTINGPGSDRLTIFGNGQYQAFSIVEATATINDLAIRGGKSTGGSAISSIVSTVSLTNSMISECSATHYGGAIRVSQSRFYLTNSTVSGNSAGVDGGGIRVYDSFIFLTNSTVSGNSAGQNGGGIAKYKYAGVFLTNSTVSGNSAQSYGGGIFVDENGMVSLTNSTVSGNSAGSWGGGIYAYEYGTVSLTNSTVSGNFADLLGGGIYANVSSDFNLTNSIVSGNSADGPGEEIYNFGGNFTTTNNLFGHAGLTSSGAFYKFYLVSSDESATSDGTLPTPLASILNTSLASNGGPTLTHALVQGSPAINTGDNTGCGTGLPIATDQRGFFRNDGKCDIGAYEFIDEICFTVPGNNGSPIVFCL